MIDLFGQLDLKTAGVVAGVATFVLLAAQVIDAWKDMSAIEKAASVIGLLLVAVSTLAVALGALSGLGGAVLAAAGIATGIAMVTSAVNSANKRAEAANASSRATNAYPAYANGGVIPPNDPYLALVGDNKTEREIIAPESTLRQIYREESGSGGGYRPVSVNATMQLDGVTVGRLIVPYIDNENSRRGVSIVDK